MRTGETVIKLPGLEIPLITVEDVEALITDPSDEDKIPLWAVIWPAAMGLSRYVWENMDFTGQRVLELGAGLGLAGVVCGLKGAQMTFSDYQSGALEISLRNAGLNGLTGVRAHLGDWRDFRLNEEYDWIVGSDILYDSRYHGCLKEILARNTAPGGGILISHPGRKPAFDFIKRWVEDTGCREEHTVMPVYIDDPHFPYYDIHIHRMNK